MNGDTTEATTTTTTNERRARKPPRPEIQIYRPGALRKGDSTKSLAGAEQQPPAPPAPASHRPEKLESGYRRRQSNDTDSVTSRGGSGSTTPDANAMNERGKQRFPGGYSQHDRRDGGGSSYNSTQSLYDTRRPGGYTEYNGNRQSRGGGRQQNQRQQFERNHNRNFNERASMRGDASITKRLQGGGGGRRRNDSINSTQSEMPPSSANEALHVDTNYDSVSQCGASSAFSMNSLGEAFSFEEMRQNLHNFASMDWSKEVEEEFAMQKEMEQEEERRRTEVAQKSSPEVVEQTPKPQNQRGARQHLQETNGQQQQHSPRKPRNRRNRRHDESDRESSFGGSIAEENEEEEELKSGERTPTSTRSSIPPLNPRVFYQKTQRTNNENNGYVRRSKEPTAQPPRKGYRGEHDDRDDDSSQYEAIEHHLTTGRLAGRVSFVARDAAEDRTRGRQRADDSPKKNQKRSVTTTTPEMPMSREEKNRQRQAEIEKNETPRIQMINSSMVQAEDLVKSRNEKAAKRLVELGLEMAHVYADMLFPDLVYAFNERIEMKLFRHTFHRMNELFRRVCNSSSPDVFKIRARAISMLQLGITFYEELIDRYQQHYGFDLESALIWPSGVPSDVELTSCAVDFPCGVQKFESGDTKMALKSLSRHMTCLGDLHRYKSVFAGSENYEESKLWYQKATQLWPGSGHPYHQLAVVGYLSNRVLDEFFYLTRALTTKYVYAAARDRLIDRLGSMRRKVEKYQPMLDKEYGLARKERRQLEKVEMITQMWIHPITHEVTNGTGDRLAVDLLSRLVEQPRVRLHRRGVSYLCDTFGLLVTKIGMEHFRSVSDRAFGHLFAALSKPKTDFSAYQLVQLSAMFIYTVHLNHTKPDGQLETAFNTLITYLTVLTRAFFADKRLVLPAINVIATWLCTPGAEQILERIPTCETLPMSILVEFNGKNTLEAVLERYSTSDREEELVEKQQGYPEIVFLSSFANCWEGVPENSWQSKDGDLDTGRLVQLRAAMAKLREKMVEEPIEKLEERLREEMEADESPRGREELVELARREQEQKARQLLIHPDYLIPDTNVFIDALSSIQTILDMQKFQILVPTRVIDELTTISRPTLHNSDHDPERVTDAKQALSWLAEHSRLKTAGLYTLTTTGKRLATLELKSGERDGAKMAYDDQILKSGLEWMKTLPAPASNSVLAEIGVDTARESPDQQTVLQQCVLLTGDRGLTVKAICGNLPCRKIDNFSNWVSSAV